MSVERMGTDTARGVTLAAYVLHLVGAIAGLTSIIGLILNYVRRNRDGAFAWSHHRWMIRSFWWALLWMLIGIVTVFIFIGWIICVLAWLWYIYRHVIGLVALLNDEPMPG